MMSGADVLYHDLEADVLTALNTYHGALHTKLVTLFKTYETNTGIDPSDKALATMAALASLQTDIQMEYVLDHLADLSKGDTPVHVAAEMAKMEAVARLIEANRCDLRGVEDKDGKPLAKGKGIAASVNESKIFGVVYKVRYDCVVVKTYNIEYECFPQDCMVLDANNVEMNFKDVVLRANLDKLSTIVSRPPLQIVREAFKFCEPLVRDARKQTRFRTLFDNTMAELEGKRDRKKRVADTIEGEDLINAMMQYDPKVTMKWAKEELKAKKKAKKAEKMKVCLGPLPLA
jgi:alkylhydroperoxidase/carboxymuconolactone decarboxylase family protein YurZ